MALRSLTALKDAGFSPQQAEAILNVVEDRSHDLATKADLDALEARMSAKVQALELRLTLRMGALSAVMMAVILAGVTALTRL